MTECERLVRLVKDQFDHTWYEQEIRKLHEGSTMYHVRKEHPLAHMIWLSEWSIPNSLMIASGRVPQETFETVVLGRNIETLLYERVEGAEEKISELISENFEKLCYEIEIAASLARKGHDVKFVPTRSDVGDQTHDLLVDGTVEVECKKKNASREQDKEFIDLRFGFFRRMDEFMNEFNANYLVSLRFLGEPDRITSNEAISSVRHLMEEGKDGKHTWSRYELILYRLSDIDRTFTIPVIAELSTPVDAPYAEQPAVMQLISSLIDDKELVKNLVSTAICSPSWYSSPFEGKMVVRFPRLTTWGATEPHITMKSLIASIKKSKRQFSGNRPAVVFVQSSLIGPGMTQYDLEDLKKLVNDVLRSNPSISAVLVTGMAYFSPTLPLVYHHDGIGFTNPRARFPVPSDFMKDLVLSGEE